MKGLSREQNVHKSVNLVHDLATLSVASGAYNYLINSWSMIPEIHTSSTRLKSAEQCVTDEQHTRILYRVGSGLCCAL